MLILHCCDLHRSWFPWLLRTAPKFDLVCLAGDLLDQSAGAPLQRQVEEVSRLLHDFPAPLAIASGNHDQVPSASGEDNSRWLHSLRRDRLWVDGDQFQLGGLRLRCIGWNCVMPTSGGDDVWIAHAPPAGCGPATTREGIDYGDHEFGWVCESGYGPRLALCGHIHDPQTWADCRHRTLVLNPGTCASSVPNHIVIDLGEGRARLRRSSAADETVALSLPPPRTWRRTAAELDCLLATTVANQAAEGLVLMPAEIESCRQALQARLVRGSGRTVS